MSGILKTTKYEFVKILKRNKFFIIPILEIVAICLIIGFLFKEKSFLFQNDYNDFTISLSLPSISFIILDNFLLAFVLPLITFMLVSDNITLEFENNTIKNILLRPVSRFSIYLGKNLAIILYLALNLIIVFITIFALKIIFHQPLKNEFHTLMAYLISIIPLSIFVFFSSFIATNLKSPSFTMFTLIIFSLILSALSIYSSKIFTILFTNYITFYKTALSVGFSFKTLNSLLLILSNGLIFFILGYLSFDRKSI